MHYSCDRLKKQKLVVTLQLPPILCLSSFFLCVVFYNQVMISNPAFVCAAVCPFAFVWFQKKTVQEFRSNSQKTVQRRTPKRKHGSRHTNRSDRRSAASQRRQLSRRQRRRRRYRRWIFKLTYLSQTKKGIIVFFCKVSLAGSTCSWRGGRFGESVRCQPGEVAAGACGSGAQAQCGEWSKSV